MVVVSPSSRMLSLPRGAVGCGTGQVEQSAAPSSKAHRWPASACSMCRICAVRKPSRSGVFGRPNVATEIDRNARLILTASNAGSAFIASATVWVRHQTLSGGAAAEDLVSVLMSCPRRWPEVTPGLRVEAGRSPRSEGGGSRPLLVVPASHAWFKRVPFRNLLSPLSQAVSLYALSPRQPSSVFRFSDWFGRTDSRNDETGARTALSA